MLWERLPSTYQPIDALVATSEVLRVTVSPSTVGGRCTLANQNGATVLDNQLIGRRKVLSDVVCEVKPWNWTTDQPTGGTYVYRYTDDILTAGAGRWFSIEIDDYEREILVFSDVGQSVGPVGSHLGSGSITLDSKTEPLKPHEYQIAFVNGGADYIVTDVTANRTVVPQTAYSDPETITFEGIQVTITGTPVEGDIFEVVIQAKPAVDDHVEVGYVVGHLDGMLQIIDRMLLETKELIDKFPDLYDPETCPEQFLNHFLNMLGWNLDGVSLEVPPYVAAPATQVAGSNTITATVEIIDYVEASKHTNVKLKWDSYYTEQKWKLIDLDTAEELDLGSNLGDLQVLRDATVTLEGWGLRWVVESESSFLDPSVDIEWTTVILLTTEDDDAHKAAILLRRKIISLAISIYKQKGTRAGLINLIRLLTGIEVQVFGWWPEETWELGIENRSTYIDDDNTSQSREMETVDYLLTELDGNGQVVIIDESDGTYVSQSLDDWESEGEQTFAVENRDDDAESVTIDTRARYQGSKIAPETRSLRSIRSYTLPKVSIVDFDSVNDLTVPIGTAGGGNADGKVEIRFWLDLSGMGAPFDDGADLRFEYSLDGGWTWHKAYAITGKNVADETKVARYSETGSFIEYDGDLAQPVAGLPSGLLDNAGAVNLQSPDDHDIEDIPNYHAVIWDTVTEGVATARGENGVKFRIIAWSRLFDYYGDGDSTNVFDVNNTSEEFQPTDTLEVTRESKLGPLPRRKSALVLNESRLGSSYLGEPQFREERYFYHFDVVVFQSTLTDLERHQISRIVDWAKPAWTHYDLVLDSEVFVEDHFILGDESDGLGSELGKTAIFGGLE